MNGVAAAGDRCGGDGGGGGGAWTTCCRRASIVDWMSAWRMAVNELPRRGRR